MLVDRDLCAEAPSTVAATRRYRTQLILTDAAERGWEDEHNRDKPGRWWLPGTDWRLKFVHDRCSIYRITPHGQGTLENKAYWLTERRRITARLDAVSRALD